MREFWAVRTLIIVKEKIRNGVNVFLQKNPHAFKWRNCIMRSFLSGATNHRLLALAVFAIVVSVSLPAYAAAQTNTVSWGQGQPTAGQGTITGSGTYTTAPGFNPSSCSITATPVGGGVAASAVGLQPVLGEWGPITINGLPKGQYAVFATIVFKGGGQTQAINGPLSIINVQ